MYIFLVCVYHIIWSHLEPRFLLYKFLSCGMVHLHLVGWGWLSWYELFLWSMNWDTQIVNLWSSDLWCEAHISWGWADHWSRPVQPLRFSRTLVFAPHASVLVGRHAEQETPPKAMGHTSWTYWIQLIIARTCKNRLVEMEPEMNDEMKLDSFVAACRVTLHEGIVSYLASATWSGNQLDPLTPCTLTPACIMYEHLRCT